MLSTPVRNTILVAEDEPEVRNFLRLALRSEGYNVEFAHDGDEVLNYLNSEVSCPALLLLDILMPHKDGLETLEHVRRLWPDLPVVMMSGLSSSNTIVEAIRRGAKDFLPKPVTHEQLRFAIHKALDLPAPMPLLNPESSAEITKNDPAREPWHRRLGGFLDSIASSDVPVLVQGETGVGKEMLSRQIHARSLRAHKPFLKINCAALPAELVESELFGYDRGAFTGAIKNNPGKFEMANGGTILLDEIGDMDVRLQAKLLQVLQDKEFIRLGSKESTRVDVRVIAATHCDLEEAIVQGRFREDLYYRLNVVNVVIPPLRERKEEILPLADYFLSKHAAPGETPPEILAALKDALVNHDWPGNIRELENVLRRFLVYRSSTFIAEELKLKTRHRQSHPPATNSAAPECVNEPKHAPAAEISAAAGNTPAPAARPPLAIVPSPSGPGGAGILGRVNEERKKAEAKAILAALDQALWNRKQAAALLEVEYKVLLYKMKKLGIGEKKRA